MEMTVEVFGVDVVVDFDGTPFIPAKVSGPPENCHPAEGGEADINSVCVGGVDITELLSEEAMLRIDEKCVEYLCSSPEEDFEEPERDYDFA